MTVDNGPVLEFPQKAKENFVQYLNTESGLKNSILLNLGQLLEILELQISFSNKVL